MTCDFPVPASLYSWPEQVMRVQDMINNRPCSVFSNNKTRNFVLFGTLPHTSKRPSVEEVNTVLQFERCAAAGHC